MTRQLKVWKFILDNLQQEIPVMLLYVVESLGSSPGRQGFCMAVNARNIMKGSVGGGIMEHKFVELAKERLKITGHTDERESKSEQGSIRKQIHDKSAATDQSGMICSGEQSIFLYLVQQSDSDTVQQIIDSLDKDGQGKLVLSSSGIKFTKEIPKQRFSFWKNSDAAWQYEEMTAFRERIHIIGGGHCGLALSKLMRMLDFHVHVYDERTELNTMLQNDMAHRKTTIPSYHDLANMIEENKDDYVVIMTFGYRTDDIALRALIGKKFKYLGLLGSRKKIEKMFADYRAEGWSEDTLASIHAPVGINIKSETPEEIAVSIAAEIIKVKNHADQDR